MSTSAKARFLYDVSLLRLLVTDPGFLVLADLFEDRTDIVPDLLSRWINLDRAFERGQCLLVFPEHLQGTSLVDPCLNEVRLD